MSAENGKPAHFAHPMIFPLLLLAPTTLDVGDGKPFNRIEQAIEAAQPGDEIRVFPRAAGYPHTAVLIRTPNLKILGQGRIQLDGRGFDYSGAGAVPRAIFQVDPTATNADIENFELIGAHNASHNGAGLRINAANRCTLRNCSVHGNDMGIMSSGAAGDPNAGADQLIDHCEIYANGDLTDPGYNHNLYLGGTSVTIQFCDIHDALTGHNLKSRAHFTLVQYCSIRNAANRELDFVDAWDTERPNSNAVLMGNVIVKSPNSTGNRTVIHFGIENGKRDGTIYLINNEITTPFASAVVQLTAPTAKAFLFNNRMECPGQAHPTLVEGPAGGSGNLISPNYNLSKFQQTSEAPFFRDANGIRQNARPTYRYSNSRWIPTTQHFVGAG